MSGDRTARARDVDRARTCTWLDAAAADGQIDATEHEYRIEQSYGARTLTDLDALVEDLQPPGGSAVRSAGPDSWTLRWIVVGAAVILGSTAGVVLGLL